MAVAVVGEHRDPGLILESGEQEGAYSKGGSKSCLGPTGLGHITAWLPFYHLLLSTFLLRTTGIGQNYTSEGRVGMLTHNLSTCP